MLPEKCGTSDQGLIASLEDAEKGQPRDKGSSRPRLNQTACAGAHSRSRRAGASPPELEPDLQHLALHGVGLVCPSPSRSGLGASLSGLAKTHEVIFRGWRYIPRSFVDS